VSETSEPRRNIEIKVCCADLHQVRQRAGELGARYEWTHRDTDTYFRVPHGRLKLRQTDGSPNSTLIAYERPDETASRISRYHLVNVNEGNPLREMLANTLGVLATVVKTRELFMYGSTRIHLDIVDGLGTFVELETVIGDQTESDARAEHSYVLTALGLEEFDVVAKSYSDLKIKNE
jgi:adenylate cyclase, class 2